MQNIETRSQEKIYLEVYDNGVLAQADSIPSLQIYDADNDADPIAGFDSLTAVDEPEAGKYSFLLTQSITSINRVLEVRWTYTIDGVQNEQIDRNNIRRSARTEKI